VDPLVFAPGREALSPELERQTVRVADFLRKAPYVGLTLSSVTSPADVEALKERAVNERIEKFQKEQGIADQPTALRRYFQAVVRDAQLPVKIEDQLLLLRRREPHPAARLEELRQRRLAATRERLAMVEGIQETRLQVAPDKPAAGTAPAPPAAAPAAAPSDATTAAGTPAPSAGAAPGPAPEPPPAGGRVEFGITGESD
jgi:hypothetical protein